MLLNAMSRCVASVRQLVACRHAQLYTMICQCIQQLYTRTSQLSTRLQVRLHQVEIRPLLVGPYQDCAVCRWTFSSTSSSGRRYADDGSATDINYVVWRLCWSFIRSLCYRVMSAPHQELHCGSLTRHVVLHHKSKLHEGQPDHHWSLTAESNEDDLTLSLLLLLYLIALNALEVFLKHIHTMPNILQSDNCGTEYRKLRIGYARKQTVLCPLPDLENILDN